jgi:hypothetical protein
MVHASMLTVAIDGECLTWDGFSLGESVLFGSLEFIVDCFPLIAPPGLILGPESNHFT